MSADREAAIREEKPKPPFERATPERAAEPHADITARFGALRDCEAELAAARRERDEWHIMAVNHGTQVEKLREALRRIEETAQAWCDRDATLGEDSVEWRLAAESRAGLIRNFARARLSEGEG